MALGKSDNPSGKDLRETLLALSGHSVSQGQVCHWNTWRPHQVEVRVIVEYIGLKMSHRLFDKGVVMITGSPEIARGLLRALSTLDSEAREAALRHWLDSSSNLYPPYRCTEQKAASNPARCRAGDGVS